MARMVAVVIEADARWALDSGSGAYVEICRACRTPRPTGADTCVCGQAFTRLDRSFFALEWKPAEIALAYPTTCPHCDRPATTVRSYSSYQYTKAVPRTRSHVILEIPVCDRVRSPLWAWLGIVVTLVFGGVFVIALFEDPAPALVALVVDVALLAWCLRVYTRVRFASFDHRRYVVKVRNRRWAEEFARLNAGRIR